MSWRERPLQPPAGFADKQGAAAARAALIEKLGYTGGKRGWKRIYLEVQKGDFVKKTKIQWHSAFVSAMGLDFGQYKSPEDHLDIDTLHRSGDETGRTFPLLYRAWV